MVKLLGSLKYKYLRHKTGFFSFLTLLNNVKQNSLTEKRG
jgi:hypothetical protein